MTRGQFAARSALAGAGVGLAIMSGYAVRVAWAVNRRPGGWHDVRDFLGLHGRRENTWTR